MNQPPDFAIEWAAESAAPVPEHAVGCRTHNTGSDGDCDCGAAGS